MTSTKVRVPRFYKEASRILQLVEEEGSGTIKKHVYQTNHPNIKGIYALIAQTLKHKDAIDKLISVTKLFENEPKLNHFLGKILMVEVLWGKKQLPGNSKPIQVVAKYVEEFRKILESTEEKPMEVAIVWKPRYVRINTMNSQLKKVLKSMKKEGWTELQYDNTATYEEYLHLLWDLCEDMFVVDYHLKTLLVFPPKTTFYHHQLYKTGTLLLQDKASCLPTYLLNPPPGSAVIDACAAPGMKTTHLAELMHNQGCLYAIEQDEERFKVLREMVELAGATSVQAVHSDFTQIDPEDYANVTHILVDPSCSGSGITGRLNFPRDNNLEAQRILKLAKFQTAVLTHAFRFRNVERVVYSTCSIFEEENEAVVQNVLNLLGEDFKVAPLPAEFDSWTNRGSKKYAFGNHCLYAVPEKDYCNGFFIVVIERVYNSQDQERDSSETETNSEKTSSEKANSEKTNSKRKFAFKSDSDESSEDEKPVLKNKKKKSKC